jgi:ABC-type uncharacterized transport system, periplasmic component
MRRREFILGSATAAVIVPRGALGQEQVRRVGVLMPLTAGDRKPRPGRRYSSRASNFWVGRLAATYKSIIAWPVVIPYRFANTQGELVASAPDLIMTVGSVTIAPVQQATRIIPTVMVNVADPVGAGFVQSLSRPGGNATGFTNFEYTMSGKWVELLKQLAPNITRAIVLRDPNAAAGIGQFVGIQSVAQSLGIELTPLGVPDAPRSNAELQHSRERVTVG